MHLGSPEMDNQRDMISLAVLVWRRRVFSFMVSLAVLRALVGTATDLATGNLAVHKHAFHGGQGTYLTAPMQMTRLGRPRMTALGMNVQCFGAQSTGDIAATRELRSRDSMLRFRPPKKV